MKDLNNVKLIGTIFFSKLNNKQSYSILNLGIKLSNGSSVFCAVNNPSVKDYEIIKSGNKVLVLGGYLDQWARDDGTIEQSLKCNDNGISFFPPEKALPEINEVFIVGEIMSMDGEIATIMMIGDRNPKTSKWTERKARIKIGETYKDKIGQKITSVDVPKIVEGKERKISKLVIEPVYDSIVLL